MNCNEELVFFRLLKTDVAKSSQSQKQDLQHFNDLSDVSVSKTLQTTVKLFFGPSSSIHQTVLELSKRSQYGK